MDKYIFKTSPTGELGLSRNNNQQQLKKDAEGCVPSASALSKTGVWCVILFGCGVFYMFLGCGVCVKNYKY